LLLQIDLQGKRFQWSGEYSYYHNLWCSSFIDHLVHWTYKVCRDIFRGRQWSVCNDNSSKVWW